MHTRYTHTNDIGWPTKNCPKIWVLCFMTHQLNPNDISHVHEWLKNGLAHEVRNENLQWVKIKNNNNKI